MTPRRTTLTTALAGTVLTTALGGGALAVAADTSVLSGTIADSGEAPRHDIAVGYAAGFDVPCEPQDGDTVGLVMEQLRFVESPGYASWWENSLPGRFCIQNLAAQHATVTIRLENVVSTDLGCSREELAAGDEACEPGDPGELIGLEVNIGSPRAESDEACELVTFPGVVDQRGAEAETFVPAGGTCVFTDLGTEASHSTDPAATLRAATDRVQFDLVFTATDAS